MTTAAAFTAHVEPLGFDGITPKFEVVITCDRVAGISGPCTSTEVVTDFEAWITAQGFTRTADWSPVCANGFASARVAR